MKKGINFGVIVSMFVACCVLLCSCANVGHNQAESAQVDLSRVDVCGIHLGEDSSYDGTVKEGYKPVCYVLYVENHSHYKMENMMMQQINIYPNITSREYDTYYEGSFQLSPSESGASVTIVLLVPKYLSDEEIMKSLSSNDIHIRFQVDKNDYTLPISSWRKGTEKEIRNYVIHGVYAGPASIPD